VIIKTESSGNIESFLNRDKHVHIIKGHMLSTGAEYMLVLRGYKTSPLPPGTNLFFDEVGFNKLEDGYNKLVISGFGDDQNT
jgi:hypothetical protein